MSALTIKLWIYEDIIATPLEAHVSAVETELAEHVQNWEEKIEGCHQKLREFKEETFHVLPIQTRVSAIRSRHLQARERGNLWFYLHEYGEDTRRLGWKTHLCPSSKGTRIERRNNYHRKLIKDKCCSSLQQTYP